MLHRISDGTFRVLGVGLWHPDDSDTLTAMLKADAGESKTPYRISRCIEEPLDCCKLFNLAPPPNELPGGDHYYDTAHVFRIYQQTGDKIELIERIDWQLSAPAEDSVSIPGKERLNKLEQWLEKEGPPDAVVIKDVKKEVVTTEFIKWMAEKWNRTAKAQIPWYVSPAPLRKQTSSVSPDHRRGG